MDMMWTYLLNLGGNTGEDAKWPAPRKAPLQCEMHQRFHKKLVTERDVWTKVVDAMPEYGINTVLVNVGEGVRYDSHPELAVEGSWSREALTAEVNRMKAMGLEPIPMLNLASAHDAWLGEYAYKLSTSVYHEVVGHLIDEVAEIFGKPRFIHLGMDGEGKGGHLSGVTSNRSSILLFEDLYKLFDRVERNGARPWIFSDYFWNHPLSDWEKRMPKDCVQTTWEYERATGKHPDGSYKQPGRQAMVELSRMGYDQITMGSSILTLENFGQTVWVALEAGVCDEHMLGFLNAPWENTNDLGYYTLMDGLARYPGVRRMYEEYKAGRREELLPKKCL